MNSCERCTWSTPIQAQKFHTANLTLDKYELDFSARPTEQRGDDQHHWPNHPKRVWRNRTTTLIANIVHKTHPTTNNLKPYSMKPINCNEINKQTSHNVIRITLAINKSVVCVCVAIVTAGPILYTNTLWLTKLGHRINQTASIVRS